MFKGPEIARQPFPQVGRKLRKSGLGIPWPRGYYADAAPETGGRAYPGRGVAASYALVGTSHLRKALKSSFIVSRETRSGSRLTVGVPYFCSAGAFWRQRAGFWIPTARRVRFRRHRWLHGAYVGG